MNKIEDAPIDTPLLVWVNDFGPHKKPCGWMSGCCLENVNGDRRLVANGLLGDWDISTWHEYPDDPSKEEKTKKPVDIHVWVKHIENKINEYNEECGYNWKIFLKVLSGRKYHKIVTGRVGTGDSSVYCFVEKETGDIYKSASYKAPAKHVRGNIADHDGGWGSCLNSYGAAYLR